jgi:preprotein translocase subunit SecG
MEAILFNFAHDLAAMTGIWIILWIIGALFTGALLKRETQQQTETEPEPTENNEPTTSDD